MADLHVRWRGQASDAFHTAAGPFTAGVADYATHLDGAAASLDNVAAAIEDAQVQAFKFQLMLGITAVSGLAMTFLTFGVSDAVAAGAIETEAGLVAAAFARIGAYLADEAGELAAMLNAIKATVARFALGMGFSAISTIVDKALQHEDVLDPTNYSAKDATNILIGGVLTGAMGTAAATSPLKGLLDNHQILGGAAAGVVGGGLGSSIGQFWLNGNSPEDPNTWLSIAKSAGVAAGSGAILGAGAAGVMKVADLLRGGPAPPSPPRAIRPGDLVRGGTGVPAGVVQYELTIPQESPLTGPQTPPEPAPQAVPPPPTIVTNRGESLWSIAERVYGDGNKYHLIAEANHITDPDRISTVQELVIPPSAG